VTHLYARRVRGLHLHLNYHKFLVSLDRNDEFVDWVIRDHLNNARFRSVGERVNTKANQTFVSSKRFGGWGERATAITLSVVQSFSHCLCNYFNLSISQTLSSLLRSYEKRGSEAT
jgi:hypothetical protein